MFRGLMFLIRKLSHATILFKKKEKYVAHKNEFIVQIRFNVNETHCVLFSLFLCWT